MARSIRTKIYYSNRLGELKEELIITEQRLQKEADGKIRYLIIYIREQKLQ